MGNAQSRLRRTLHACSILIGVSVFLIIGSLSVGMLTVSSNDYTDPNQYWVMLYRSVGGPQEYYELRHNGVYSIPSDREYQMNIGYSTNEVTSVGGRMYRVVGDERHLVFSAFGANRYTWQIEGWYEVDLYNYDIFGVSQHDPAAFALAKYAHAALPHGLYLTTIRFRIENAGALPVCNLTATPTTVSAGESVELAWTSTAGTLHYIDQEIGLVGPSGSQTVAPEQSTTYSMQVHNSAGEGNCSVEVTVTPSATLHERAAALAKELVNQPDAYELGARGWDYLLGEFTSPERIIAGYNYVSGLTNKTVFGPGIDCSGLIYWAFNKSKDPNKAHGNYVANITADGMFRDRQSHPIAAADLQPGDALFFNNVGNTRIGHAAMYVGESGGYDVVEARSEAAGIVKSNIDFLGELPEFAAYHRIHQNGFEGSVQSGSPVDLIVTDPEGNTLAYDDVTPSDLEFIREVPGELYYSEVERGHDGNPKDVVYISTVKEGDYHIRVLPEPGALPTDTYSLTFTVGEEVHTLASGEPLSNIPAGGFRVELNNEEVAFEAITIESLLSQLSSLTETLATRPPALMARVHAGMANIARLHARGQTNALRAQVAALRDFLEQRSGAFVAGDVSATIATVDELLVLLES